MVQYSTVVLPFVPILIPLVRSRNGTVQYSSSINVLISTNSISIGTKGNTTVLYCTIPAPAQRY